MLFFLIFFENKRYGDKNKFVGDCRSNVLGHNQAILYVWPLLREVCWYIFDVDYVLHLNI